MPEFYVIEHTNNCNLRCKTCPNRLDNRERGFMSHEMFKNIADQLKANNEHRTRLVLHGTGEPLLNPNLFDNLDYLERNEFGCVDFSTNGNLLTKEKAERLVKYKCLNFVKVSLNSSRKEIMEDLNTGSNYDRVIENIRGFLQAKEEAGSSLNIVVQLMQTPKNESETEEEVYNAIGRRDFQILHKRMNNFSGLVDENEYTYPGEIFWNGECVFADKATLIQWDGDLVGCCNDNTKLQIFGNIKDGIFSENVKAKRELLKQQLKNGDYTNLPICKKCLAK